MRRLRALSTTRLVIYYIFGLLIINSLNARDSVDPCKRQPFRGRCPVHDSRQTRSQFVLRYYVRKGECVSYPYGYCSNDQDEPHLFRFKEECEEACLSSTDVTDGTTSPVTNNNEVGLLNVGHDGSEATTVSEEIEESTQKQETYGTNSPLGHNEYEVPKTECQRQRERTNGLIKGGFVPECTQSGAFQSLQCEPDGQICFCVNENGIELSNSRCQPGQPKPECEKISSAKPMRTNECVGGADSGPCRSQSQRWFYDEEIAKCRTFTYSGCGGNGNNYATEASCQRRCHPIDDGTPKCAGGATALVGLQGLAVNCSFTDCPVGYKCNVIQENHICCPDSEKSADAGVLDSGISPSTTLEPSTTAVSRCAQSKDRGPCDRYELRFYYNADHHECKYFFYGGCEGNENNFKQIEECERVCNVDKPNSATESKPTTNVETISAETITETTSSQLQTELTDNNMKSETNVPTTKQQSPSDESSETSSTTSSLLHSTAEPIIVTELKETETSQTPTMEILIETSSTTAAQPRSSPRLPEPTLPPQNTVRTRQPTTSVPLPSNSCQHPLDLGHCGGQFVRWWWNPTSRMCETFTYTGCGGNGNNFASREECLGRCHKEAVKPTVLESPDLSNVCNSEIDIGECGGTFMRYAFDRLTGECRHFKYGGCGGNGNNFPSLADCKLKCLKKKGAISSSTSIDALPHMLSKNICEHEMDTGECNGLFHRYVYDNTINECRQFNYGGCGGNGNNFATIEDCRIACVKVKCAPAPECDMRRCQLVRDAHGCSFCSCPPVPRHPPVNVLTKVSPVTLSNEMPPTSCPLFNSQNCMEPCIVFKNRIGCHECVCPVIPTTPQPSHCSTFNVNECVSPCKIFTNRAGCHECVCTVPSEIVPHVEIKSDSDISMPDLPSRGRVELSQPQPVLPRQPAPPAPSALPSAPAPAQPNEAFHVKAQDNVEDLPPPPSPTVFGELGEKCTQPLDPGPCNNFVQRWHFNPVRAECEPFQYGGCAGNRNHFFTQMECMVHCGRFLQNLPTVAVSQTEPTLPSVVQSSILPTSTKTSPTPTTTSSYTTPLSTTTTTTEIDDTCLLAPEPGPCTDYVPRWFFNAQTAKCEQFSYGSCNGNKNNFIEREQCERRCRIEIEQFATQLPVRCTRPRAEGFGNGYFPKWYYNQKNLRCEQFVYKGDGGNDNQFINVEDCERSCKYFTGIYKNTKTTDAPLGEPKFVAPKFTPRPIITFKESHESDEQRHKIDIAERQSFGAPIARTAEINDMPAPSDPIEEEPRSKYPQDRIEDALTNPDAHLPPIGKSMVAVIDYSQNKRLNNENKAFGIKPHVPAKESETQFHGKVHDDNEKFEFNGNDEISTDIPIELPTGINIPVCPNGLNAMQYADGRPVMCLPGKNQCPDKSVCYFNGIDYFCCPNEDDPYDKHVFGGYDGEEVKHGYKDYPAQLSIHSIRRSRRGAANMPPILFSLDQVQHSLRFDDKPVHRISSASSLLSSRRVSPCLEEMSRGSCNEAQLRFFYDINSDRCHLFYYSGCDGNTNNFATEADCERRCKIGTILIGTRNHAISAVSAATTPVTDITPSAVPAGQCPGGEMPLGDPSPVICGNQTDSIGCPVGYYCRVGPPDVCCPTVISENNIDIAQIVQNRDVRRKPFISTVGHHDHAQIHATENVKYDVDEAAKGASTGVNQAAGSSSPVEQEIAHGHTADRENKVNAALDVPVAMCPDGSDALMSASGVAVQCGSGFDGHDLCPQGFYCSIDPDRNGRLCCPLSIQGSNLGNNWPTAGAIAPYFGIRGANPGEVIDRGSLPSDPKPPKLNTPAPRRIQPDQMDYDDSRSISQKSLYKDSRVASSGQTSLVAEVEPAAMPHPNGSEYDHLIMKANNRQSKMIELEKPSVDNRFDREMFYRGVGAANDDPFETLWERIHSAKTSLDAKAETCRQRPSEGRACHADEPSPRSNLQFFYSEKDRVCKVFFYRGCGGNTNRFSTKRECEQHCAVQV